VELLEVKNNFIIYVIYHIYDKDIDILPTAKARGFQSFDKIIKIINEVPMIFKNI